MTQELHRDGEARVIAWASMKPAFAVVVTLGISALPSSAAAESAPRLIDTVGEVETELGITIDPASKPTWAPKQNFIVEFDGYSTEDVVLVQWKQGGKALGKPVACSADGFVKEVQSQPTKPMFPANMAHFMCQHPKEVGISKAGTFTFELTYKQTLADKKFPLGTLEMTVIEIKQGSGNKQFSTWVASQDHRMPVATIEEQIKGRSGREWEDLMPAMMQHHEVNRKNDNYGAPPIYVVKFWTKFKNEKQPPLIKLACMLDGKKVAEGTNGSARRYEYWTYTSKTTQDNVRWQQHRFALSNVYAYRDPNAPKDAWIWGEHPGDYRCVALAGGETVKEVFFTIAADGTIKNSECQAQVNTVRHVHLVRAKDTAAANMPVDAKAGKKGFFGRVAWAAGCPAGK